VSIKELTPGHVEELADMLDMFVRDYTLDLPTAVLAVLRAVFYMFNGDNSECVVISKDGYIEKKYIRAATATWQGAKLILRRKSRFLRRLRALVSNTCLPDPSKFNFTSDCLEHLKSVVEGVKEADFDEVKIGQYCILKLLVYCRCVYRAYELQDMFPEYFDPGQSAWFRYLMNIRYAPCYILARACVGPDVFHDAHALYLCAVVFFQCQNALMKRTCIYVRTGINVTHIAIYLFPQAKVRPGGPGAAHPEQGQVPAGGAAPRVHSRGPQLAPRVGCHEEVSACWRFAFQKCCSTCITVKSARLGHFVVG
jgi:hypothetical protein